MQIQLSIPYVQVVQRKNAKEILDVIGSTPILDLGEIDVVIHSQAWKKKVYFREWHLGKTRMHGFLA